MIEERRIDLEKLKKVNNASPFQTLTGIQIVEVSPGVARVVMPVERKHLHAGGVVHGGVIASVIDTAIAFALIALIDAVEVASIELKVNYIAPVRDGELTAEGKIVHSGRRIAVGEAEVKDEGGKLVARAMGTYTYVR